MEFDVESNVAKLGKLGLYSYRFSIILMGYFLFLLHLFSFISSIFLIDY